MQWRRRWSSRRIARRDLSGLDPARVRELLAQLRDAIDYEVRYFTAWGANVGLEPDDLRQLARVAVLDAAVMHGGRGDASVRHWAKRTIRWRLTEALTRSERPEEPLEAPHRIVNGHNPEELVERQELISWMRTQVGRLSVRQRTIVACRLEGETLQEIASTLGISKTRVHQESRAAFETLRIRAQEDHLDEEAPKT